MTPSQSPNYKEIYEFQRLLRFDENTFNILLIYSQMGSSPQRNYGQGVQKIKTALDCAPLPHDSAEDELFSNLIPPTRPGLGHPQRVLKFQCVNQEVSKGVL